MMLPDPGQERTPDFQPDGNAGLIDEYYRAGLKVLVLGDKNPFNPYDAKGKNWQTEYVQQGDADAHFARGGNIGIQMGEVSGWLGAVDLDGEEARRLATRFLPTTLMAGKAGEKLPSHYVYRSEGADYLRVGDVGGGEMLALKTSASGKGHQIKVAPSVHAAKGRYEWRPAFDMAKVADVGALSLTADVRRLGTAALIRRYLPAEGRHEYSKAIAGMLLRWGYDPADLAKIMEVVWEDAAAPADGVRSAVKNVYDTARALKDGEKVTGGTTLNNEYKPNLAGALIKAAGLEGNQPLGGSSVNGDSPGKPAKSYMRTDLGNAERFVDAYHDRVRWCPARKKWLVWHGQRYAWDDRGESVKLAHDRARAIFHEAAWEEDESKQKAISTWASASQGEKRINAMLSQAKPYLAVGMDELDRDPWLINCQNGTLDLKTGRLKEHDPADLITRIAPVSYDPGAARPRFERFLRETLVDAEVVGFVKRYAGYTLTGATRERILTILYGSGKNGKTTLVELLHEAMGDYARNTDVETLLIRKYSGVGNDVAALKGARFVSAAEVEKGRRLAESKVKQLTGRDTVTARFLFGENFDFKPEFKLWLSTNNKPVIQGTDDAIWDRLRLIPFTQRFDGDKADPLLFDKLQGELAGVFAWMVEGCLQWQEHGLGEPKSVTEATQEYREDMDTLAAFFEDRCVLGEKLMTPASRLYKTYQMWCDEAGENAETQKMLSMRLSERGFISKKITRGQHKDRKGWLGIGLRADDPEPDDPDDGDKANPPGPPGAGDPPLPGHAEEDRPLDKKERVCRGNAR